MLWVRSICKGDGSGGKSASSCSQEKLFDRRALPARGPSGGGRKESGGQSLSGGARRSKGRKEGGTWGSLRPRARTVLPPPGLRTPSLAPGPWGASAWSLPLVPALRALMRGGGAAEPVRDGELRVRETCKGEEGFRQREPPPGLRFPPVLPMAAGLACGRGLGREGRLARGVKEPRCEPTMGFRGCPAASFRSKKDGSGACRERRGPLATSVPAVCKSSNCRKGWDWGAPRPLGGVDDTLPPANGPAVEYPAGISRGTAEASTRSAGVVGRDFPPSRA